MDRLYRSRGDRMLAGVAGGLAELWDADPSLIRVIWALLVVFTGGLALIVYIVMAIVVPDEDDVRPVATPPVDPLTGQPDPTAPSGTGWTTPSSSASEVREARRAARTARRAERGGASSFPGAAVAGAILILLGGFFLAREFLPQVDFDFVWPVILIGLGVVLVLTALRRPGTPGS